MRSIGTASLLTLGLLAIFASASAVAAEEAVHVVKPGQTLAGIAQERLGDASRWKEIARLNDLKPPYKITVGQKLRLPQGAAAAVATTPDPSEAPAERTKSHELTKGGGVFFVCGIGLVVVAAIVGVSGVVWFYVVAFSQSIWWGLGTLFIQPIWIVFLVKYWDQAKRSFIMQIIASVIAVVGIGCMMLGGFTLPA